MAEYGAGAAAPVEPPVKLYVTDTEFVYIRKFLTSELGEIMAATELPDAEQFAAFMSVFLSNADGTRRYPPTPENLALLREWPFHVATKIAIAGKEHNALDEDLEGN